MRVEGLKVCRVSCELRGMVCTDLSYILFTIYDKIFMEVFECG